VSQRVGERAVAYVAEVAALERAAGEEHFQVGIFVLVAVADAAAIVSTVDSSSVPSPSRMLFSRSITCA